MKPTWAHVNAALDKVDRIGLMALIHDLYEIDGLNRRVLHERFASNNATFQRYHSSRLIYAEGSRSPEDRLANVVRFSSSRIVASPHSHRIRGLRRPSAPSLRRPKMRRVWPRRSRGHHPSVPRWRRVRSGKPTRSAIRR